MRFNFFGFKGELNPIRSNKKSKNKQKDESAVVGVGFKACSEFAGSSRFDVSSQPMASEEKNKQNGSVTNHLPSNIPKNWCGTPVPTSTKPIPPEGISVEDETIEESVPSVYVDTKPKAPQLEDDASVSLPNTLDIKSTDVVKEKKPAIKPTAQDIFASPKVEDEDSHQSTLISMTQMSHDESREDDFGKITIKSPEMSSRKKSEPTEIVRTERSNYPGYSDQAASIFFRSDSPELEQRIRNFTIRRDGSDDDDNLSQTSA